MAESDTLALAQLVDQLLAERDRARDSMGGKQGCRPTRGGGAGCPAR
jgi:hypothetical protein